MVRYTKGRISMTSFTPKIRLIIEHINTRYASLDTLSEAALLVDLSPQYLSRRFKKEVGIRFHDYLLFVRIQKALLILRDHSKRIKEISYEVGFSRPEIFSKTFKRFTGIPPKAYRTNILFSCNQPVYLPAARQSGQVDLFTAREGVE